jgi:hypothetical protein
MNGYEAAVHARSETGLCCPDILDRISVFVIWRVRRYVTWLLQFSFTSVCSIISYVAGGLISNFLYHTEILSFSVLTDFFLFFLRTNTAGVSLKKCKDTMHTGNGYNYVINFFVIYVLRHIMFRFKLIILRCEKSALCIGNMLNTLAWDTGVIQV